MNLKSARVSEWRLKGGVVLTWGAERVVFGEVHLGLEVAAIVDRIGVEHDKCDIPLEDVLIGEL